MRVAGLRLLAAAWLVPWDLGAFPTHLLRHMGLAAVAPLLSLGFPRTLAALTLLGAILVLAPRGLYVELCGTVSDIAGQQLGGLLMLGNGTPAYLGCGLWLTARVLRPEGSA